MADGVKCFKCGQTGHWSRDCTVPPSEWLSRPKAPVAATAAASASRPSFTPDRAGTAGPSTKQGFAAQTPAAAGTQPRGQGCYKCGKTGHWARDCNAPPSEQIPRTFDAAENEPPSNVEAPKSEGPKKAATKRKRKTKIRFAELKERDALSDVFCNFPERFAKKFKGKGHEVSDLKRLLEMYRVWQKKHFPLHGFDEALDQIADIGKTNQLKMEMREMRQGVLKVMEKSREEAQQQQPWQQEDDLVGEDGGSPAAAEEPEAAPAGDGADWDEDDELLAMQQEAWEQEAEAVPVDMLDGGLGGPSGRKAAHNGGAGLSEALHALPGQATASQLAEDEELLALAMDDVEAVRQQPSDFREDPGTSAQQQPSASQLAEDEELLALAMEDDEQIRQQPIASKGASDSPAQQQQQPSMSQIAEDEELLPLAMEADELSMRSQQPAAASAPACTSVQQQHSASQLAEDEELLALATEDDEPLKTSQQKQTVAPPPPYASEQQQPPSASQGAEDEELLALAMEDREPQQKAIAPAQPSQASAHQAKASRLADDEELLALGMGAKDLGPSQSQAARQQKPAVSPGLAAKRRLGKLSRLSQLSAAQQELQQQLPDADDQKLLALMDDDRVSQPTQLWQAPKQAAAAPSNAQDSSGEDEEPLVFARKKQAVLAD